ncbi:MAG: hypothetical protein KC636_34220, partial [Myxococcales bacterium]|nr:hypothetical protein [Myxococcales bacterium]
LARLSPELIDPKPLVTLTTAPIASWDLFIGRNDTVRAIDLRAHGSELALGVRLVDGDPYGAMVRLLRIDAAQL